MFKYEKMLEYPVNVKKKDLKMARKYLEIAVKKGELKAAELLGAL